VATSLAALPADLHGALHDEPAASDVVMPPPADVDGYRSIADHRFPDLATLDVHPARSLTRLTLAGAVAATLYRTTDGCDVTLSVVPGSLASMLTLAGGPRMHAHATAGAQRSIALVMGFEPSVRLRVWSADDAVWVASSEAIGPARLTTLAELAAERTNATSMPSTVVHVMRVNDPGTRSPC